MHQMELWQQFLEQEALPLRNAQVHKLHEFYIANRSEIVQGFVPLFGTLCEQILLQQEHGELQSCSTIHVSLMRTRLIQGDPAYMLHASDRRQESEVPVSGFLYDASWIYSFMDQWIEECEDGRRRYMNRIDQAALESWQAGQLYPFHIYMVLAVRHAMDTIRTMDSFEAIRKEVHFEVRVGEYQDHEVTESVYRFNGLQRSSIACKGWLESRLPNEYIYEHIADVNLCNGNYAELDFNHARFEEVDLSGSSFEGASLLGTRFERCQCTQSNYGQTLLLDTDFRDCNLTGANFDGAWSERDTFIETHGLIYGIHGLRFQGANLSHATFRYARIAGDFTGAELEQVNFTGADLSGSRMLAQDRFRVELTSEQRASVEWVEA
ncbi:pentapeptide repeat-containing protein [Paenibacillus sp. MER 99-2]|uniref:pentapeptide repeat-containing protein n=1 Tax=Paenibacillus sp. MER 99-2 TaxID=2939572 RepID=UPI00203D48CE|nr:pentapeptide repeat-containing protein [Paenibacillus sp. MER 99-2]MCM3172044.1 pentapeptide repeat-containing protein [Paenibacillus sp. MER 99-2]